jgi:hypothetical protein
MDTSSPNNQHTTERTSQRMLSGTEPNPSNKDWPRPVLRESLPSDKTSVNVNLWLRRSPPQLAGYTETDHYDSQIDANCSKQTSLASTTTEDKLAQHSGPSRTRHQLRLGTVSHPTSKSRLHSPVALSGLTYGAAKSASSEQSSRTKSAEIVAPRPRTACRFSYEDYKHTQIMGWLERGGGKEVNTIFFIPNLSSRLTVKADISSLGDKAGLRNEAASQYGSVSDCKLASDCVLDTGSVEAFSHQPSFSSLVAWDFGAKQRINPAR